MKFFSYTELKNNVPLDSNVSLENVPNKLRELYTNLFNSQQGLKINGRLADEQDVFFLIDLYEKEENQIFSSWVETDETLNLFLKGEEIKKIKRINHHDGHLLKERYQVFLAYFLYPALNKNVRESIEKEDLFVMILYAELSQILSKEKRLDVQRHFQEYIKNVFTKRDQNMLLSEELVALINSLDNNFYSLKIEYIDQVKHILLSDRELWGKGVKRLKQLKLHKKHKEEVSKFVLNQSTRSSKKKNVQIIQLLRTPLFYVGLLTIAVLIYIFIPKEPFKRSTNSGVPEKRSGLDSLTLAEIEGTDTLLGFKDDSVLQDPEAFIPAPDKVDAYQVIDGKDTLKNQLVKALTRSMVADYNIQEKQQDTKDCNALSISEREDFQMTGVLDLDDLNGGYTHTLVNETPYDLYIILFENQAEGNVYGSFVPTNGKISFDYQKDLRLTIYCGKSLTKFNPLLHKNGGYGSVQYAKEIDERFSAHFCELNMYNLQIMGKTWVAKKRGAKTTISSKAGPLSISSDAFRE